MSTVTKPGNNKTMRKDAAFSMFPKLLLHIRLWNVVVVLLVPLARDGRIYAKF